MRMSSHPPTPSTDAAVAAVTPTRAAPTSAAGTQEASVLAASVLARLTVVGWAATAATWGTTGARVAAPHEVAAAGAPSVAETEAVPGQGVAAAEVAAAESVPAAPASVPVWAAAIRAGACLPRV
ncbi:hypothetical protein FAIPA1_550017 [Frankia sp. AiPs1]